MAKKEPSTAPTLNLKTVAETAGVSVSTASLALRGNPAVAERTRLRVMQVAESLGYRTDPALAKAMTRLKIGNRATQVIGIVSGFSHPVLRAGPDFSSFWNAASIRAKTLGYKLDEFWLGAPGMNPHRVEQIIRARGIEGIALTEADAFLEDPEVTLDGIAAACSGSCAASRKISSVISDSYLNTIIAIEHTLQHGYRKIGYASLCSGHRRNREEPLAVINHLAAKGRLPCPPAVYICDGAEPAPFLDWFRRERPEVVISTVMAARWLEDAGYSIPRDVAFTSINTSADGNSRWAGIDSQPNIQADAVVDLVVSQMATFDYGFPKVARRVVIEGRWVDGPSLPHKHA